MCLPYFTEYNNTFIIVSEKIIFFLLYVIAKLLIYKYYSLITMFINSSNINLLELKSIVLIQINIMQVGDRFLTDLVIAAGLCYVLKQLNSVDQTANLIPSYREGWSDSVKNSSFLLCKKKGELVVKPRR